MKKGLYPFGALALAQFTAALPAIIGQLILMWFVSKATLVLSNVPGPKTPLVFNGIKSKCCIALIPGNGDLAFGISAISHCDKMTMAV